MEQKIKTYKFCLQDVNTRILNIDYFLNSFLTVSNFQIHARSVGCGGGESGRVKYSLKVGEHDDQEHLERVFRLDPQTGRLCLGGKLDFERRSRYQLTVFADGQGRCYG